jgi:hypothetical protein
MESTSTRSMRARRRRRCGFVRQEAHHRHAAIDANYIAQIIAHATSAPL